MRYLNAKPLIHDHARGVRFAHPSALADALAAGRIDAALCPVWEWLRADPARYVAADGVAIAARGPVHSVFLVHRGDTPAALRRVRLDPSSRSSVNLLRVLLAEFHDTRPEWTELSEASLDNPPLPRAGEGLLLIGDQANRFRARHEVAKNLTLLDLGEEWRRCTGLPFVFAVWLIRADFPDAAALGETLRAWAADGLARMDEVVRRQRAVEPEFARWYLTRCISYALGRGEKAGLREYARLLAKHGLIPREPGRGALRWV